MRNLEQYFNDLYLYHKLKKCKSFFPKIGSSVHLNNRSGVYKVVNVYGKNVRITCNKWDLEMTRGQRSVNYVDVCIDDIKCYKGGNYMSLSLEIKFSDQSASFTYGVEYGRLLEKMQRGDNIVLNYGFPVRVENKKLLEDTCKVKGYIPSFGKMWEGWIEFVAIRKQSTDN